MFPGGIKEASGIKWVKGKQNCNKYISFFIAPMEEIWFYERLFFKLVIIIVKNKRVQCELYIIDKN